MKTICRSDKEIDRVLNEATDAVEFGSKYPGMSYEEGILSFAQWLFGDTEDTPFDE